MTGLKDLVLRALTAPLIGTLWSPLTRQALPVLMLHRFADPETGSPGFDPAVLRRQLAALAADGTRFLRLDDALARLGAGTLPRKPVCFTVDDGYADFLTGGLPVFAEFDCPVTLFVTTGFVDGALWMWWDRIAEGFARTRVTSCTLPGADARDRLTWSSEPERSAAALAVIERFKRIPETEKRVLIDQMLAALDVELPTRPTDRYAPATWDDLRAAAGRGVAFGPHTVTHPILARCDDAQSEREIAESWRRLMEEMPAAATVPVLCYPNGGPADQGPREAAIAARHGLTWAVTTIPGSVTPEATRERPHLLPRYAHPRDVPHARKLVGGLERLLELVRGLAAYWR